MLTQPETHVWCEFGQNRFSGLDVGVGHVPTRRYTVYIQSIYGFFNTVKTIIPNQ